MCYVGSAFQVLCRPSVTAVLDAVHGICGNLPEPCRLFVVVVAAALEVPVGSVQPQLGQAPVCRGQEYWWCAIARHILGAFFVPGWFAGLLNCMCPVPYFGGSSLQQIPGPVPKCICPCPVHNSALQVTGAACFGALGGMHIR